MRRFPMSLFAALIGTALCLSPAANAEITAVVEECDSCHGPGGVSVESDIPSIAGASGFVLEEYMFMYLDDARPCRESTYRSGDTDRPATTMCAIAKELSEEQLTELADYYGAKEFVSAKQDFDADKAAIGAKIHRRDCEKCHSDGGSYADDDAGMLAGQWMPYLERVFEEYAADERVMLEDKMKEKVDALDAVSITALIHYYGSQQ